MIAYNVAEAKKAFVGLADALDEIAKTIETECPFTAPSDDEGEICKVIDADPVANVIRQPFDDARTLARMAGDAETEDDLRKRHGELVKGYDAIAQCPDGEREAAARKYAMSLRSHAAFIRARGKTMTNQPQIGNSGIEVRLASIEAAANRAADNSEKTIQGMNEIRGDIANLGDDVCHTVEEMGGETHPPKPKDVDGSSRMELYKLLKKVNKGKGKFGWQDRFLDNSKWRYRGYTAREIYKDGDGLTKFMNAQRMCIKRNSGKK